MRHRLFFVDRITACSEDDILEARLLAYLVSSWDTKFILHPFSFGGTHNFLETSLSGFDQEKVDDRYKAGIQDGKNNILDTR
jgi:hypothetical protein